MAEQRRRGFEHESLVDPECCDGAAASTVAIFAGEPAGKDQDVHLRRMLGHPMPTRGKDSIRLERRPNRRCGLGFSTTAVSIPAPPGRDGGESFGAAVR
jgi:hypothetical protein